MKRCRYAGRVRHAHGALGLGMAVLAVACATGETAVKPSRAAEERVLQRVRAHEVREVFEVRLNPTGCGAPPFEVRLDTLWQRVFLEPDDPAGVVGALANRLESLGAGDAGPATMRVRGRILAKVRVAPNRSPYPILVVIGECGDESCGAGAVPSVGAAGAGWETRPDDRSNDAEEGR